VNIDFDIFIIGGGINGAGIARDAVGRGLKVALAEKNKVGSATSSWSTKLIHGGLRYLENYEFKLVRESLKERTIIGNIAPTITKPLPFIIPHTPELRSIWLIRLGLFLYDNIGGKSQIPKSSKINIIDKFPNILKEKYKVGFKYFDLQVDDKKLVELNIKDAKIKGAKIFENTKVVNTIRYKDFWEVILSNDTILKTKVIINASGPWINEVLNDVLKINTLNSLRLVRGSHIITKKLYDEKIAFTLQNYDKRIVFILPYSKNYTLIGTTEVEVKNPNDLKTTNKEIDYLISCANKYLKKPLNKKDIKNTYSGIRPLIEDYNDKATAVTRDYIFDINAENKLAPVLSVYGGKLTTYRKLSEKALNKLKSSFPKITKPWTHKEKL
tara:strand:+ start:306 stop:1457 length:1152 start_codon:yes stop_codon:yes gene_type:complete